MSNDSGIILVGSDKNRTLFTINYAQKHIQVMHFESIIIIIEQK